MSRVDAAPETDLPERDLGPLAWVEAELRRSLEGAAKSLRRFLRDAEPTNAPRQWPPMALYGEPEPSEPRLFENAEAIGIEAARSGKARGVVRGRGGA